MARVFGNHMSRYIPVSTNMDSEDHYHSPYDTNDLDCDAHYEAPTCLKRNPSGSLFIPSGPTDPSPGEKTLPLDSRLRYNAYSPHHTIRQGAYSPQHSSTSSSSNRQSETVYNSNRAQENTYSNANSNVYNVGTLGTRLGSTLLSRGGVGGNSSPARSPHNETYKNLDGHR